MSQRESALGTSIVDRALKKKAGERYKDCVEMALEEKIQLRPFSSRHPMSKINEVFEMVRKHELATRAILEPDF